MDNRILASAIALALGAGTVAHAAGTCPSPDDALYVAGSSAAKNAFGTALNSDLFGGTEVSYSSSNGDFEAFCGTAAAGNGAGITAGNVVTVYYRAEGGSVVGALPVFSGNPINFADLSGSGCNVSLTGSSGPTFPTTGTSAANGTTDTWGGCVTTHGVELGITDLESSVFYTDANTQNYPTAYSTTVFGAASHAQLITQAAASKPLFTQVFGIFVNPGTVIGTPINLSRETIGNILSGNVKNWSAVPNATGGATAGSSLAIALKNREAGSGTRTGATLYFLGEECTTSGGSLLRVTSNDAYATSDALKNAASVPGAITYAGIDNNGKQSNLTMVQISGVTPSLLAAAAGQYDYWYEATANPGNTTGTSGGITTPGGSAIESWLVGGELQNIATAPHAGQILAIPTAGSNTSITATVPVTASTVGGKTIYVNPFTRLGNSCNLPSGSSL
jgi:hypothetical protein